MNEWDPIAFVRSPRKDLKDDHWGDVVVEIELAEGVPTESLAGFDQFSHIEVIYLFHRHEPDAELLWQRHPRGNPEWPNVGIFAQRASRRPNRIGATIVSLKQVQGRAITVTGLDAADETPVLDIKPVFNEFLPQGAVKQPTWVSQLMKDYWRK